jgi:hypothetical protein
MMLNVRFAAPSGRIVTWLDLLAGVPEAGARQAFSCLQSRALARIVPRRPVSKIRRKQRQPHRADAERRAGRRVGIMLLIGHDTKLNHGRGICGLAACYGSCVAHGDSA